MSKLKNGKLFLIDFKIITEWFELILLKRRISFHIISNLLYLLFISRMHSLLYEFTLQTFLGFIWNFHIFSLFYLRKLHHRPSNTMNHRFLLELKQFLRTITNMHGLYLYLLYDFLLDALILFPLQYLVDFFTITTWFQYERWLP